MIISHVSGKHLKEHGEIRHQAYLEEDHGSDEPDVVGLPNALFNLEIHLAIRVGRVPIGHHLTQFSRRTPSKNCAPGEIGDEEDHQAMPNLA